MSMPELFRMFGLRFYFWSNEHLPVHVHIKNGDGTAVFDVDPLKLRENNGIKTKDLYLAESIIEENKELIIENWDKFFKNKL